MRDHAFWQRIEPPATVASGSVFTDAYPAVFDDGRQLVLPIRTLPDGEHAVASLIINQASFAVVDAIAADLADKLAPLAPDVIVGLPTLGLTLASAVAARLGHARYVPLGTSRKFWYREELSVPLSSITSPDVAKRLYIDPRLLPLIADRRVVLIDDVISSGVSIDAGIRLLAQQACTPVAIAVAMLQSERWKQRIPGAADRIITALRTPMFHRVEGGWSA
jgi:adenine/guanine phosphoribosyltransferase-like PRPP-binding protein